jgi:hypothetical protein
MVSTFVSYRMVTADYAKSMARTLSDAQVAREQTYYRDNIGKVTSVDDFLKDQRLYAYAMKAYGLEDMTYAKAFMRKVLESDLSKEDSFTRKLVDTRYITFARAFNFSPTGDVEPGLAIAQDTSDQDETIGLYSEFRTRQGAAAAAEVEYYKGRIGTITSVDQLVADPRLFAFALESYGIDSSIASTAAIKSVLTSDLSDPNSVANKFNDPRYKALASAFSFEADGSVASGGLAQTAMQLDGIIYSHYENTGKSSSPAAAAFKTDLFSRLMAGVSSVDDLLANSALRDYALVAVGIDPIYVSDAQIRSALTSDTDDPSSALAGLDPKFRTLALAFNFNSSGELDAGVAAQTADQLKSLTDSYFENYAVKAQTFDQEQTTYFKNKMATVSTVDELVNDSALYAYVLNAFGLDPSEESRTKIRQVLLSDPNDGTSFASRLRDSRYTELAAAFNFGADGKAQGALRAQLTSAITETVTLYSSKLGPYDLDKSRGRTESEYYGQAIQTIESVDDLLADKRLVAYLAKAHGFEGENISNQVLRQALTADPYDLKSFVNQGSNTRFRELAGSFNFGADGAVKRVPLGVVQDPNALLETQDLYVRQTIELRAGEQNQGVRLALYFQRKASTIQSAYSILADKALIEVALTALGMPDSVAQTDTDALAKMLERRLDFADFKDPKKLEKFLARFTALYDLDNQQAVASSPATTLFQQQDSGGIMGSAMLASLQSLKVRV